MSFILLLLYIITVYIRPQEWVSGLYGLPLIYILTLCAAFFAFVENSLARKAYLWEPPNKLLLAFFGCILMSHITHTYLAGTLSAFMDFLPNVIMFFLFVNILISTKRIKIAVWFIIFVTVVLALQGISQHDNGVGWAGQYPYYDKSRAEYRVCWIGIFHDPNDLALALVAGAGFLVSFLLSKSNLLVKVGSIVLLSTIGRALYYTNSRGGFLAMASAIGFFLLQKMKNKMLALAIGGGVVATIIMFGPSRLSQVSANEASAYGRIEAWYHGIQMLKSAPFFGVGYNMYTDFYSKTAHNSYILVGAEIGIVGLFFWIALIYNCFKGLTKVARKKPQMSSYALGLESSLVGFLSASYFLSRSYIMVLYLMLALAAALMYANLTKEEYAFTRKDAKVSAGLTVGILVLVWASMRFSI